MHKVRRDSFGELLDINLPKFNVLAPVQSTALTQAKQGFSLDGILSSIKNVSDTLQPVLGTMKSALTSVGVNPKGTAEQIAQQFAMQVAGKPAQTTPQQLVTTVFDSLRNAMTAQKAGVNLNNTQSILANGGNNALNEANSPFSLSPMVMVMIAAIVIVIIFLIVKR